MGPIYCGKLNTFTRVSATGCRTNDLQHSGELHCEILLLIHNF